jgi:hypothetical protein
MKYYQLLISGIIIFLSATSIEYLFYGNFLGYAWINFLEVFMFLLGAYVGTKLERNKKIK